MSTLVDSQYGHTRRANAEAAPETEEPPPFMVPYVTSRSTDVATRLSELTVEITPGGPRLAYTVPTPTDRDNHGNLRIRMYDGPGRGRPLYECMHAHRQRACMEDMLCQVCAGPADRNKQGWLFIDWRREDSPPTWPERSITSMPPLCARCARVSAWYCPFLRRTEYAVLRVRKPQLYGVSGTACTVTADGRRESETDFLSAYSKPRFPGMLASRLHRELRGVTVVDLP
ncbi:hypothetical protein ACIOMQ_02260 [Streptomyces sp. NPDC087845]|uniref:hypothetical protein n=1 Tax=Streptomyces sp. NPDC087845 TaxID=3365806 RepID=UPI00382A0EB9